MDISLIKGVLAIYFLLNTVILIRTLKHLRKTRQHLLRNHLTLAWFAFFGTLGYCVHGGQCAMTLIRAMEKNTRAPCTKGEEAYSQDRFQYQSRRRERNDTLDV